MAMKLNQKIQFCGKERKFQRCPNSTLKDYQKTIEDMQDKLLPLAQAQRDFQFDIKELDEEIEGIEKHIELLERLEDPTDEEIRECMDLTKQKLAIQKKIHKKRIENDEKELQYKELYDELDEELNNSYGEFASKILKDFDPSEIDEADSTDLMIAPRLGEIYRLATVGASQKDIDKFYKKIVTESFR